MLIRVNFQFPEGNEIRYLERLPMQGGVVLHDGTTWFATEIDPDESSGYNITLMPTQGRARTQPGRRFGAGIV
jgi:hypothetical protein